MLFNSLIHVLVKRKMKAKKLSTTINTEKIPNYMHYIELPLKLVGCWDWYPNSEKERQVITNYSYLCLVLFVMTKAVMGLAVHLYTEWLDIMSSLDKIADSFPLVVSLAIVAYHAVYRNELYDLMKYMNDNFKYHSARGLTNMTILQSYGAARKFARIYTACTMFSVTMYVALPFIVHQEPLQNWIYMDITRAPYIQLTFMYTLVAQWFVGLAMGQFGNVLLLSLPSSDKRIRFFLIRDLRPARGFKLN